MAGGKSFRTLASIKESLHTAVLVLPAEVAMDRFRPALHRALDEVVPRIEGGLGVLVYDPLPDGIHLARRVRLIEDVWSAQVAAGKVVLPVRTMIATSDAGIGAQLGELQEWTRTLDGGAGETVVCVGECKPLSVVSGEEVGVEGEEEVGMVQEKFGLVGGVVERALGEESGGVVGVSFPVYVGDGGMEYRLVEHGDVGQVDGVVLGGTFDHAHAGHVKLLSIAGAVATKKVVVGVTGHDMLSKKADVDRMEPWDVRAQSVRDILRGCGSPSLTLDISEIHDPFGPSIVDEEIQAIVVSSETEPGAIAVNKKRIEKGLKPLHVISTTRESPAPASSTFVRKWIRDHDGEKRE